MVEGHSDHPEYHGRHETTPDTDQTLVTEAISLTRNGPDEVSTAPERRRRPKVMLLGSGEPGRGLVVALQRLGAEVIAVDRHADAPLHGVADRAEVVEMTDSGELTALIDRLRPGFVVTTTDAVATDALISASESDSIEVVPSVHSARLAADREGLRRLAADDLGLPTAPFWFAGSVEELRAVAEHAGFPMVVKPVAAPHGEGESVLLRPDDVEPAWRRSVAAGDRAANDRVLAEMLVDADYEVTLLTVRSQDSGAPTLEFCAPIGHRSLGGDGEFVVECWQPQPMSSAALEIAKSIAARIVKALGGRGVFGVELLVRGDEVYFSDVTVRPYDTALVTMRTQRLSGFELHARAILGLPTDAIMISPGAARLLYSDRGCSDAAAAGDGPDAVDVLAGALAVPESDVVMIGDRDEHARHKRGAVVATGSDIGAARDRAGQAAEHLGKLWPSSTGATRGVRDSNR